MCGRFNLRTNQRKIIEQFGVPEVPELPPRYNIAPTQGVPTITFQDGARHFAFRRWGLIPSWAKDAKIGNSLINARGDTVAEKPSFRSAFKKRRCLILASGFYEWKQGTKPKQPFHIRMKDDRPFGFAGLHERWKNADEIVETCAIITTEPNEMMANFHDRMPVILSPNDYDVWLDPEFEGKDHLQSLLRSYPADEMLATPVSTWVNIVGNQGPKCIEEMV